MFSESWALLAIASFSAVSRVSAQGTAYQQCGGIGWTGATTCVSGNYCFYSSAYYSQCLPGTATSSKASTSATTKATSTSTSTTTKASSTSTPSSTTNYWFSFGDSYTQTGFVDTDTLPAPGNPLGNPVYPGYTAVGGTNWIDLATTTYNKSLVLTYNYAYGGATIDATLVAPYESTVLSVTDQVNEFLNTVASKPATTPWTSADSLFSIWIGINDIGNSWYTANETAFLDVLLDAEFALVQKLYAAGARNFLWLNVPPVDRSPLMLAESAADQALEKSVITTFNSKLAAKITAWAAANSGVKTFLWDSNAAFTTVLNNPTAYGFVDAISYGNTGDFWGNNLHPSTAAQTLWGQQVGALLGSTIW